MVYHIVIFQLHVYKISLAYCHTRIYRDILESPHGVVRRDDEDRVRVKVYSLEQDKNTYNTKNIQGTYNVTGQ